MSLARLALFAHSVRHTRPQQLLTRAWLLARRKSFERLPALVGGRVGLVDESRVPALSKAPPLPLLPPRTKLIDREAGRRELTLLQLRWPLELPMKWETSEWEQRTHLERMNLHYMEWVEGLTNDELEPVLRDWIRGNPPYRRGYWLDSWNAYSLSIRCVVWMQQLAARPRAVSETGRPEILRSLVRQLAFLEHNLELDIGGNHLLMNVKALLWAGRFFEGSDAQRWHALGARILDHQLTEQILPDGVHFERSPAYHAAVFAVLLECHEVLDGHSLQAPLAATLERMAQALVDLTHPDGAPSLMNDGGLHMAYPPRVSLDAWVAGGGTRPEPRACFALPDAGYYGLRRGDAYFLADCGPIAPDHLPGHGHGDVLAFEWTLAGQRMLVDAGVLEYQAGPWRDYSRATTSHNTVTVDDADQCEFWSSFRVGRRARILDARFEETAEGLCLVGAHDGYRRLAGAPIHRRRFDVAPDSISVQDRVEGGSGQPVRARLLLHPECEVECFAGGAQITRGSVTLRLETPAPLAVERASWCPDFGKLLATKRLVLDYGSAPAKGWFRLERLH